MGVVFQNNHIFLGSYPKIITDLCFIYNSMMQKVSKKETVSKCQFSAPLT